MKTEARIDSRACLCRPSPPDRRLLKGSLLAAALVFSSFDTLSFMVRLWMRWDGYSYGFLVPFISLYFVYADRHRLKGLRIAPCIPGGAALVLTGCLMLLLGHAGSVHLLEQASFIALIPGLVLLLLGREFAKALALPLFYLMLMLPMVIDSLIGRIHWPFQLFTAAAAEKLLAAVRIPVVRNVQYLILPNITLEVANACSGVRYLTSVVALAIPLAYFTQRTLLRRALLVIFAAGIGVLANPLRVALIGTWAYYTGQDVHGPLHLFQGYFVSGVGLICLFTGTLILSKKSPYPKRARGECEGKAQEPGSQEGTAPFNKAWVFAVAALLAVGCFVSFSGPLQVPPKRSLHEIAHRIGDWKGEDSASSAFSLDADHEVSRIYRNSAGRELLLQIGYLNSQSKTRKLIPYGLQELYRRTERIVIPLGPNKRVAVNKTAFIGGEYGRFAICWHSMNGHITAGRFETKLMTALRGLTQRRTNGATIIISNTASSPGVPQATLNDGVEFAGELIPVLSSYLP